MDGIEGGSRYLLNYGGNEGCGSTRFKVSGSSLPQLHSHSHSQLVVSENYVDLEEDEEEAGDDDGEMNASVQQNGGYADHDDGEDDTDNNNDDDDDDDDVDGGEDYKRSDGLNLHRHPKKRKLKSLSSSFELAPRVVPPAQVAVRPLVVKPGRRNTLTDWTKRETFVLLDAWGERFLQRGRKSLRSEEWQEVAEQVSKVSKFERTDTQCRNRLDTLKKKYKKEKALFEQNKVANDKWVYFKKMNMLMEASPPQQAVDSGEFVFMNPNAYLNRANELDEKRDSPGNANSQDGDDDDDDLDLLPPKKSRYGEKVNEGSFKLLADSINRFSEIYEKIEYGKRKQMVELEKMRMDFYKDLELQKQKIFDRARDEIAKIRQGDHEENDDSAENVRG